ncbi:MAG: fructosamine kinase family protein [Bacteroidetes bacterium]|nr:fructosamine kinase family protein [Bacteroidota bacterium]
MTQDIIAVCENILNLKIESFNSVSGGDINQAFLLQTKHKPYFLKFNRNPDAIHWFIGEKNGLEAIEENGEIKVPKVLEIKSVDEGAILLMEFIESGFRDASFWERFGRQLARLHKAPQNYFGFPENNFIGSLPQSNAKADNWSAFYQTQRLEPQIHMARDQQLLSDADVKKFESLYKAIAGICPEEPPSLIHGDLWSGNYLCGPTGTPYLIDPATSYSHREMDIAMTRLFGGFNRDFYKHYENEYPLQPGFESRLEIYQLYYLLVHLNLFGSGYYRQVSAILKSFS